MELAQLRTVAWRRPHHHHRAAVEGCTGIQRRLVAGPRLGDADPPTLRHAGLLGDPNEHLSEVFAGAHCLRASSVELGALSFVWMAAVSRPPSHLVMSLLGPRGWRCAGSFN